MTYSNFKRLKLTECLTPSESAPIFVPFPASPLVCATRCPHSRVTSHGHAGSQTSGPQRTLPVQEPLQVPTRPAHTNWCM